MQVDQPEQLLDVQGSRGAAFVLFAGGQFGKGLHGEPEGARGRFVLRVGHQGQGLLQHGRVLAPRRGILRLQERQQRFFKAAAPGRVVGRWRLVGQRNGVALAHGGRWKKQVGRVDAFGPQHAVQRPIIREQAQRLRRRAGHQVFQVLEQGLIQLGDHLRMVHRVFQTAVAKARQRLFRARRQHAGTGHVDHHQCAMRLVQVRARVLQRGGALFALAAARFEQGGFRTAQRFADFHHHP